MCVPPPQSPPTLIFPRRRHRIHSHHSRRDQKPYQEPPPRSKERLLAYPPLLHPVRPNHWPERPVHLPRPLNQDIVHLTIHHCVPNGRRKSRRFVHKRRDPHLRHQRREPRFIRWHTTPVRAVRGQARAEVLREAEPESRPLDRGPGNQCH